MSDPGMDCATAQSSDWVARYVAGRLPEDEAEAFESHFFSCETCWDEVRTAIEVRAALSGQRSHPLVRGRGLAWVAGLAAAAVALLFFTLRGSLDDGPTDVFRGSEAELRVDARAAGGLLTADWPDVPGADVYSVQIFTEDGRTLYEQDVPDSRADVESATLPGPIPSGVVYWRVEALDALRRPVGRSSLVPLRLPPR